MGTRVAKDQTLKEVADLRYVDSVNNHVDDITQGVSLVGLVLISFGCLPTMPAAAEVETNLAELHLHWYSIGCGATRHP